MLPDCCRRAALFAGWAPPAMFGPRGHLIYQHEHFGIEGDPVGYTVQTYRGQWVKGRASKYRQWKDTVRLEMSRSFRLVLPMVATPTAPILVSSCCWFRHGRHPDPENVRKAIVDALFGGPGLSLRKLGLGPKIPGGDKWVGGFYCLPRYSRQHPRTEVLIEWVHVSSDFGPPQPPLPQEADADTARARARHALLRRRTTPRDQARLAGAPTTRRKP